MLLSDDNTASASKKNETSFLGSDSLDKYSSSRL